MGKREKQICMNHKESVIFESKHDKCPVCKESLWTFTYSGERECNYNLNGSVKAENVALPSTTPDSPTSQPQNRDNPQNGPETASPEKACACRVISNIEAGFPDRGAGYTTITAGCPIHETDADRYYGQKPIPPSPEPQARG